MEGNILVLNCEFREGVISVVHSSTLLRPKTFCVVFQNCRVANEKIVELDVTISPPDGGCNFLSPEMVTIPCDYDLKWFPFDSQSCSMKVGSWHHDATYVMYHDYSLFNISK